MRAFVGYDVVAARFRWRSQSLVANVMASRLRDIHGTTRLGRAVAVSSVRRRNLRVDNGPKAFPDDHLIDKKNVVRISP